MESLSQILGRNEHFTFCRTMFGDRLQDPSGRVNHLLVPLLENLRRPLDDQGTLFVSGVTRFCAQTTQNMLFKAEVIEEEHTERFEVKSLVTVQTKSGEPIGMVHVFHEVTPPPSNTVMEVRDQFGQPLFRVNQSSSVGHTNHFPDDGPEMGYQCVKIGTDEMDIIGTFWEQSRKFHLKFPSTLKTVDKALILVAAQFLHQQNFLDNDPPLPVTDEPHQPQFSVYDSPILRTEKNENKVESIPEPIKKPVVMATPGQNHDEEQQQQQQWDDTSDLGFFDKNCGHILYWFCWGLAVLVTAGVTVIILTATKII